MARRDNPQARCTTEIPPKPKLTASLAAMMRRVRSSKSGHTERNFCLNSARVLMLRKHSIIAHRAIPLFIYTALVAGPDGIYWLTPNQVIGFITHDKTQVWSTTVLPVSPSL